VVRKKNTAKNPLLCVLALFAKWGKRVKYAKWAHVGAVEWRAWFHCWCCDEVSAVVWRVVGVRCTWVGT
jgi:hypothetical protein